MGWANCRFREETGCTKTGSQHYLVRLEDLGVMLNVPSMWKHYMTKHLVQPTDREKEVVMATDPSKALVGLAITGSPPREYEEVKVMYVERTETGYDHEVGTEPDTGFIQKLELILSGKKPSQTRDLLSS